MWVSVWILVYEGRGFESTSWFLGDVGLILRLFFWGGGGVGVGVGGEGGGGLWV